MKGVHVATNNVTDNIKELEKEREGEQLSVNYYMAQATFSEITCSNWLRRVTCRSNFPYWTGPDYGFRQPFCLQMNNEMKL